MVARSPLGEVVDLFFLLPLGIVAASNLLIAFASCWGLSAGRRLRGFLGVVEVSLGR